MVGNGGILNGSGQGLNIDAHDYVFRYAGQGPGERWERSWVEWVPSQPLVAGEGAVSGSGQTGEHKGTCTHPTQGHMPTGPGRCQGQTCHFTGHLLRSGGVGTGLATWHWCCSGQREWFVEPWGPVWRMDAETAGRNYEEADGPLFGPDSMVL